MIKLAFFVGLGGFLGSALRFLIATTISKWVPQFPPSGTLAVNIMGCFILGMLIHSSSKMEKEYFLLLTTGFCGGFTTFSTFGLEKLQLILNDNLPTALIYMMSSIILGVLAAGLGWYIGKTIFA